MSRFNKGDKVLLGAEVGVYRIVVKGVVFVVGVRQKNRSKVNSAYTKRFKVWQALGNSAQVAAVKVVEARL